MPVIQSAPIPALNHSSLLKRLTAVAGAGGLLLEVAPRRYRVSNGDVYSISAAAIGHALAAGVLRRERVRSYRIGLQA